MTGSCNVLTERLYLLKDTSGDISVGCNGLAQHQIDCIRFLFNQYKKLNPGVVLNYPPDYSALVQVVNFISAIREELNKPILIVCEEGHDEQAWRDTFTKWMNTGNDSTSEQPISSFITKQIHIKKIEDVHTFHQRQWSILIVNSDRVNKKFLKCPLKVDFKIWITSVDVKNDREMLRSLYMWLYPRSDKLILQYLDNLVSAQDTFIDKITLDAIVDGFVLVERNLKSFTEEKRTHQPDVEAVHKVTKKNKDATGTKIKRSKTNKEINPILSQLLGHATPFSNNYDDNPMNNDCKDFNSHNYVEISSKNIETDNDNEEYKMDVESFIRDNEPLESDSNLSMAVKNLDNTSGTSVPVIKNVFSISANGQVTNVNEEVWNDNEIVAEIDEEVIEVMDVKEEDMDIVEGDIDFKVELDNQETHVLLNEQNSLKEDIIKSVVDQDKTEMTTSMIPETDCSLDSKLKLLEERALKRFKGSVLDKLF